MIIAIDGPAASGKGTLAKRLAAALDCAYLDTGLLYRATGRRVLDAGGDPAREADALAAAHQLDAADLARDDLRDEGVGSAASKVAAIPAVRTALLEVQRRLATHPPQGRRGAVLDGRDIGTVVCPDAAVKIFLTASLEERARRRYEQLRLSDPAVIYERVLKDLEVRDARDSGRTVAPLVPAPDAIVLDTDRMTIDEVFDTVMAYAGRQLAAGG